MENQDALEFELAMDLRYGFVDFHYPRAEMEIRDDRGVTVPRPEIGCGGVKEILGSLETESLCPGDSVRMGFDGFHVPESWKPGRYWIRFVYDSTPVDPATWASKYTRLTAEIIEAIRRVHHVRIESDWIPLDVRAFPPEPEETP